MFNKMFGIQSSHLTKSIFLVVTMGISVASIAKDKQPDNKIAIDMSDLSTTKEEVAVLQVLSEICPPMLTTAQQQGFNVAYNTELKKLMPTISDPRLAVQYLSTQQDYKQILNETRQWTLSYPKAENQAVCKELATAKYN